MALNDNTKGTTSLGRRLFWGTNVTLAVLLVVFLVVVANVLANKYNVHKDVSGGMTGHRLSERSKKVLDKAGELSVTTVYTSNDPERNWKEYLPKLRDFCEEVARYSPSVKVRHISSPDEQNELRNRVSQKFGSATGQHKEATDQALALWTDLKGQLEARQQTLEQLLTGGSWLNNFSTLAGHASDLARLSQNLNDTTEEVRDLVQGEGVLPRYSEANSKITTLNDDVKRELQELQTWARDMQKLVQVLSDPNAEFLKVTREKNQEIVKMVTRLQETAGDPKDTSVPDDPAPVIKNYATWARALGGLLLDESGRLDAFLKEYPALGNHSKWSVQVDSGMKIGGMSLQQVLSMQVILAETAQGFTQTAQQLESLPPNVPKDQLQNLVRQLREFTARRSGELRLWIMNSVLPFQQAAKIDEPSRKFLAEVAAEETFKDLFKQIDDLAAKIKALPEQKMDEIGERLKEDNIVVVEKGNEVRIIPFNDVWPLVDRRAGELSSGKDGEHNRREFNGDSAITNAILDMQHEKPFATVIFVAYETQPPPQMRQFQRPMTGPLPLNEFDFLRDRLQQANFAVKEWNLSAAPAGPDQKAPTTVPEPPAPEDGTMPIYVFLPPAEQPPMNPFGPPPQGGFGEKELAKVREVLSQPNARAIFLALASPRPPTPMAPPPSYAYNSYLQEKWGVRVEHAYQVIRAVPSAKDPGMYSFDPIQFTYMRMNHFTNHPIGEPLRVRRLLTRFVCPVVKAGEVADVEFQPVLEVPGTAKSTWAESDFLPILKALRERSRDSTFSKSGDVKNPPFPVIAAAVNKETGGKVVVMGTGASLLGNYLESAVPRIDTEGEVRLVTDPPPTENVELFANTLYWLGDRSDLIAAGPADVPFVGPITEASRRKLWALTMGWALAVLVIGGAVMFVRRR